MLQPPRSPYAPGAVEPPRPAPLPTDAPPTPSADTPGLPVAPPTLDDELLAMPALAPAPGRPRTAWLRGPLGLALALLLPPAITLATLAVDERAPGTLGLYALAIIVVALVGGVGPGIVATVLSVALGAYWILPPSGDIRIAGAQGVFRLTVLAVVGVVTSVLVGAVARARARATVAADEAEHLAADLRRRIAELQRETAETRAHAERLARTTGEYQVVARALSGAREAADAERRRIARLLESVTDGFCTLDAQLGVTFANDALLAMWRRPREQLLGRMVTELLPSGGARRFQEHAERTLRERASGEFEYRDDELATHFAVKVVPFDDGLSVVLRDIGARVRAEVGVRASEARYRALVEATSRLVWSASADGRVEDMPFWRDLTGQTAHEVRGEGWTDALHADDRGRVRDAWRRAVAAREIFQGEFRVKLRDGTHRWFRARAVPVFGDDDTVREWVGSAEDVDSERRAAEGRAFLEHASEALVASLDVRGTLSTVVRLAVDGALPFADTARADLPNADGGFDCVAFESRNGAVARAYRDLEEAHPVPADAPSGFPRVIATGEPDLIEHFDVDLLPKIEETVAPHAAMLKRIGMYSGLCVPLRARGDTLGALTLVLHGPERRSPYDRRDLALAEELGRRAGVALDNALRFEAAEAARREAEQANRAKADFLAVMSHELRTPLNAIAGYAELLLLELRGTLTEEQREDIRRIQRSQHHLLALVNDVLNFAKLDAGRVEFDIEPVPVATVLEGLEALVAPQMEQKQLAFESPGDTDGLVLRADLEKVRQILLNLLSNAVKATMPGGRIALGCLTEGPRILLRVEDTGRGIPGDKLERIFEPFVQLDRRLSSGHEGTGLGLAISRELARAMGGDLTVESEVGRGSRFTVSLPRA